MLFSYKNMNETEKREIKTMILEELIGILQSSVIEIDKLPILDNSDLAARRAMAHLVEAIDSRLDDLDVVEQN